MKKSAFATALSALLFVFAILPMQSVSANQPQDGAPERWDKRFGKLGIHGLVSAIAEDQNGNIYFGGDFEVANHGSGYVTANNIVRWDGESFHPVGNGTGGDVRAIVIDDNGMVYVGGSFSRVYHDSQNFLRANNIARWDGTHWHPLGELDARNNGVDRAVEDLHIMQGMLYLGGDFKNANQRDGSTLAVNHIAGWNGYSWFALGTGTDSSVKTLESNNGILYAGGNFQKAGGIDASAIARWDGSAWSALEVDPGPGVVVNALVFDTKEKLYAGGSFITIAGQPAFHIAMWDGAQWNPLGTGTESVIGSVHALAADSIFVYAGGTFFDQIDERTVNNIARWDGSRWLSMQNGMQGARYGQSVSMVKTISVISNRVYAGGMFTVAGTTATQSIGRWTGSRWQVLGEGGNFGVDYTIEAIGTANHGVYVGGSFYSAGSQVTPYLARWDGEAWHSVGEGVNNSVHAIAVHGDLVYVGGTFVRAGGLTVNRIALWDGFAWHTLGGGVNGRVNTIAVDHDGNVYAGGEFLTATNPDQTTITVNRIAKWDGERWHALGQGTSDHVYDLAVHGSHLFAGGRFRHASGETVNFIAEWDGSGWQSLAGGMDLTVTSLAVDPSGNLYAGGLFHLAGQTTATKIARWDGSSWHDVDGGFDGPMINTLTMDGHVLYAGGVFENAGNVTANGIARLVRGNWTPIGSGVGSTYGPGTVHAIAVHENSVFLGGFFWEAGGYPSSHIGLWSDTGSGQFDPLVFVNAPGIGMAVATGSEVTISWEHAQAIEEVKLEMHKVGPGLSWQEIDVLPAGEKQHTLEIGDTEYEAAYLRISDTASPAINSISGPFAINTPDYLSTRLRIPYDYGAYRLFHRNIDGWSFLNRESNLWPFEERFPDFDTFCAALTEDFCYNALGLRRLLAVSIWRTMQLWGWQGSCSGFSASSLLFFNDHMFVPAEFPGHTSLYSVPVTEDARRMINAMQIRFLLPVASDFFKHYANAWTNTPVEALEALEAMLDQHRGHLSMVLLDPDSKKSVHTIQPFQIVRDDDKAEIHCYDSNHPVHADSAHTTILTVDLASDTWTYQFSPYDVTNATSGLFTSPDLSYFLERPDVRLKTPSSPVEPLLASRDRHSSQGDAEESHVFIYPDPGSGVIIENQAGQQIGRLSGDDLLHSLPGSVPILPPVSDNDPELPLGYFIPAGSYRISAYHYGDMDGNPEKKRGAFIHNGDVQRDAHEADVPPGSRIAVFTEGAHYTYHNLSPAAEKADLIHLNDGLSVVNPGNQPMHIALDALTWDEAGEKLFSVRNISVPNGDSLHFTVDNQRTLQLLNMGSAKQYQLEVTFMPDDRKAGTVIYDDIIIAGNARHRLVPPWDDIDAEPMRILIDSNLDGVFDDSVSVDGEYATDAFRGLEEIGDVPSEYALFQNYPNPFNAQTTIRFHVPETVDARLDLYNILGQHVAGVHHGTVPAGSHEVVFDASRLASGVYIYRMQAGGFIQTRKMMLMK
ncbi:MAG: T9SS C-terminal target domain-containing protein [Balneolaceae bacterium]|nr:MAG: T9SS C-terminal target domain-containing protein [Balneolaceae bacterium]